jgi:DNA-binding response OmpR family regulator
MKHIILVEDDPDIRALFPLIFDPEQYDVITLSNGDQIMQGETDAPDLFILDKSISGANGLDLCRFIKNNKRLEGIPVVMLSASPDIHELAVAAGADGVIPKPFVLEDVRSAVAGYISK